MGVAGLVRILVLGRKDGFRARLRRRILGGGRAETKPQARREAPPAAAKAEGGVVAGGSRPKEPPKNVTPPEGFEVVLHREALAPGELAEVIVGGTAIALANVGGKFFAMSNTCPHAGGPIGDGRLDEHKVTCPYHGWSYDVRDGKCFVDADVKLPIFDVRVVGDAVCVRI